jgi:hypothetical protein
MKNLNNNIGNRTHEFPTCSAVSQPTALSRAPVVLSTQASAHRQVHTVHRQVHTGKCTQASAHRQVHTGKCTQYTGKCTQASAHSTQVDRQSVLR